MLVDHVHYLAPSWDNISQSSRRRLPNALSDAHRPLIGSIQVALVQALEDPRKGHTGIPEPEPGCKYLEYTSKPDCFEREGDH